MSENETITQETGETHPSAVLLMKGVFKGVLIVHSFSIRGRFAASFSALGMWQTQPPVDKRT